MKIVFNLQVFFDVLIKPIMDLSYLECAGVLLSGSDLTIPVNGEKDGEWEGRAKEDNQYDW